MNRPTIIVESNDLEILSSSRNQRIGMLTYSEPLGKNRSITFSHTMNERLRSSLFFKRVSLPIRLNVYR